MEAPLSLEELGVDFEVAPVFPLEYVRRVGAFVFRLEDDVVHVAVTYELGSNVLTVDGAAPDPKLMSPVGMAGWITGRKTVLTYLVTRSSVERLISRLLGA